ncbi:hypothetical protein EV189_3436 [Motilibacter rhizosphaerae]|uniref:Uncharacterized protein n=1 Tax=Motilibacter rhizosphaerae TaxID=598652 RepID=A0A4Q7NBG3_9ACTN|nr:hypothetical protein [Motilibacter rhizosphaerae]RZS79957.1 hypothetical protein EV189_3436 [Motilibacter rhizosphaerae]
MQRRLRACLRSAAPAAAAALVLLAGCSAPSHPPHTYRVAVCVSPRQGIPADEQVELDFRQQGVRVAAGSVPAGGVFEAPVPSGRETEVYADGRLTRTATGGGGTAAVYLRGPGCPETPTG